MIEGNARPLPPAVDTAAFRIVQESLTSVIRHAGPARATVAVRHGHDGVEVEVTDDGRAPSADGDRAHGGGDVGGGGHGLAGMRERVALLGGELHAGARHGGGYRVEPVPAVIRVALADDRAGAGGVRRAARRRARRRGGRRGRQRNEAIELARAQRPRVILMDIQMPEVDGIEATRQIAADPDLAGVRVLILDLRGSTSTSSMPCEPAPAASSSRTSSRSSWSGRSRSWRRASPAVAQRDPPAHRRVRQPAGHVGGPQPGARRLTDREREVLALVGGGLSNEEIAAELFISVATARTHVSRAMTKLHARDRAQLVVVAYESRLVTPGHPAP